MEPSATAECPCDETIALSRTGPIMSSRCTTLGVFALSVCLQLSTPAGGRAQEPVLEEGQRARITVREQDPAREGHASAQMLRGTVLDVAPDSLVIRIHPDAGPIALRRAAIERVELSRGVRSRLDSALHHAPRAALMGAFEFYLLNEVVESPLVDDSWTAAAIGAGVGVVVGTVVGALRPEERWTEASW